MRIRWRENSQVSPAEAILVYIIFQNSWLVWSDSTAKPVLVAEMGSRFSIDSGCYMTSLAATIFIASLVTFGVLMVTLLIAISTMLQSCENKNSGIIQVQRLVVDDESLSYCKILSLHSNLNSLDVEEEDGIFALPLLCRDVALQRIKQGVYLRELNFTIQMVLTYFNTIKPGKDHRDVVVVDVDDINL